MKVIKMYPLFLIFVIFRTSDATDMDCRSKFSECPKDAVCSVYCNDDCINDKEDAIGTVFYSGSSSICKSAIHDFRISQWNSSERTVAFKRGQSRNIFFGSNRMHIPSQQNFRGNQGGNEIASFKFVSPYISENILDVASLHRDFLFRAKSPSCYAHFHYCFVDKKSKRINVKFQEVVETTNVKKLCIRLPSKKYEVSITEAEWKMHLTTGEKFNAGYMCYTENNTLSTLTSIAFRRDAHFYPPRLTITVNVNEEVRLQMKHNGGCENKATIWRKDGGDAILENVDRNSIFIPRVEVGHSGIYSLECVDSDVSKTGFVQLIVRTCPAGKFGNMCTKNCSKCFNGGICHDLNGECICPPGFYGPACEKACTPGTFGRNCNMKCTLTYMDDEQACKGALICLPHPYGCSCGAGFKGLLCNETCEPGTFGADCNQKRQCHCANGEDCSIYTGFCRGKCDPNWYGERCDNKEAVAEQTLEVVELESLNPIASFAVNLTKKPTSMFFVLLLCSLLQRYVSGF